MPPADPLLHALVVEGEHVLDQPGRLGGVHPAAVLDVAQQPRVDVHPESVPDRMSWRNFLPGIGQES
ncbi:hypothetical protein NSI01_43780 [Pimelobacter simplex]|nr:hypothetical protein NSI01_43780 [Pimelobacter simplex]